MIRPTRSLFRIAENASTAASSAVSSRFSCWREPKFPDADMSTSSSTVISRSSVKSFMYVSFMRAETFQSMRRMSSPAMYCRTSENAMPRPLNTEWYCPAMRSRTRRSVTISILRIFRSSSRLSIGPAGRPTRPS